ncbi:MAG: type VII toxin-antitoxin system HepT family RNase toxin [Actinomycetota bacterium]
MVDPDRVRRLLASLDSFVTELTELRKMPLDGYRGTAAYSGRYVVQAAAQACLDIANHVISSEGFRVPNDFRDAFTVLEEQEVLDARLAENMRALVGLRNRLVHLYGDVDDELIHSYLAEVLADVGTFAGIIASRFGL